MGQQEGQEIAKEKKGKRATLFRIEKVDPKFADGMRQARKKEGGKFVSFKSVQVISRDKAEALIAQGVECIPMQWIDTDKDEHMRKPGGPYVPLCTRRDSLHEVTSKRA